VLVLQMVKAANGTRASAMAQSLAASSRTTACCCASSCSGSARGGPQEAGARRATRGWRRRGLVSRWQLLARWCCRSCCSCACCSGSSYAPFPAGRRRDPRAGDGRPRARCRRPLPQGRAGGWASTGLSLVADAREATATFTYQPSPVDVAGTGLDTAGLDEASSKLLPLGLDEFRKRCPTSPPGAPGGADPGPEPRLHGEEPEQRRRSGSWRARLPRGAACRRSIPAGQGASGRQRRASGEAAGATCARRELRQGRRAQGAQPGERFRVGRYTFVAGKLSRVAARMCVCRCTTIACPRCSG